MPLPIKKQKETCSEKFGILTVLKKTTASSAATNIWPQVSYLITQLFPFLVMETLLLSYWANGRIK